MDAIIVPSTFTKTVAQRSGELNVPITIVSVGPDRKQTLMRENVMA